MRSDGQRCALAMFGLEAGAIFLGRRIVPQQQDSGFRKGPLEMGIADLRAGGPVAFARGFLGTCDESARGHEILHARETVDVMDVVEQEHTQNRADAGDGLQSIQGLRIVLRGCLDDGQLDVAAQPTIGVNLCGSDSSKLASAFSEMVLSLV